MQAWKNILFWCFTVGFLIALATSSTSAVHTYLQHRALVPELIGQLAEIVVELIFLAALWYFGIREQAPAWMESAMTEDKEKQITDTSVLDWWDDSGYARKLYADVYGKIVWLAEQEAEKSGEDVEVLKELAYEVLDDLFGNVVGGDRKPIRWRHQFRHGQLVTHDEMFSRVYDYGFHRAELRSAVAEYLKHPWMHTPFLDWFCADTLTFSEYLGTVHVFYTRRKGILRSVAIQTRTLFGATAWAVAGAVWRFLRFLVKWGIWLVALLVLGDVTGLVGPLVQIVLTTVWFGLRVFSASKANRLLNAMLDAHRVFDTTTFSWKVAARELETARQLGAKWDGELWKLVEAKGGLA